MNENDPTDVNAWADYMEDMRDNYPWAEQDLDQEMQDVKAFEEIVRETERRGF